ncbi:MAG: hypothetical protein HC926_03825 [Synechococcaceae cyanobacterium SM2_3_60]|nr:hypothetical protein [Synechococcaceae cyanobacterium SM2_3_60]
MLLLVQHGMTDTPRTLTALAQRLAPEAVIVAQRWGIGGRCGSINP